MPPRDPPLPEGTDQIIDTNFDEGGSGETTASGAGTTGIGTSGSSPTEITRGITMTTDTTSGAGATGDNSAFFNEGRSTTGGTGSAGGTTGGNGGGTGSKSSGVSKAADTIVSQLKEQASSLRDTAGDQARSYAASGKRQATDFLTTVAQIIEDAAGSVEQRLGGQYSGFGNRAADQVNSLARTLDERDIDDLVNDARAFVRRSPAMAIGIAAVAGFAVARVVRSGVAELTDQTGGTGTGGTNTTGTANAAMGSGGLNTGAGGTGTGGMGAGGTGAGATGGLDATSGGFGEQGVGTAGTLGTGAGTGTSGVGSSAPKY